MYNSKKNDMNAYKNTVITFKNISRNLYDLVIPDKQQQKKMIMTKFFVLKITN